MSAPIAKRSFVVIVIFSFMKLYTRVQDVQVLHKQMPQVTERVQADEAKSEFLFNNLCQYIHHCYEY